MQKCVEEELKDPNPLTPVLLDAINRTASDIHLVPGRESWELHYRIEDRLALIKELKPGEGQELLLCVKRSSCLDIAEKRLPQDGRIRINIDGKTIDIRVATIPTVYGEKVTLRVLDSSGLVLNMNRVFHRREDQDRIKQLLQTPFGIVIFSGPIGSGKTTSA